MKGIVVESFGGPEVLCYKDINLRDLNADELKISVKAVGVNPVDTYIRAGTYARKPNLPYTPGSDGAGIVSAVGSEVTRFKIGDRVYLAGACTGTYTQETIAKEENVFWLPDPIPFEGGACLNVPYLTAYIALFVRGRAQKGETVFVHGGTGGVGLAAIQLAKAAGLTVIASGGTEAGRKLLLENGASHALDHRCAGYMKQLGELTDGGPHLILEMLANVNLQADLDAVRLYGRVAVIGSRGTIEIAPRSLMARNVDLVGVALANATGKEKEEGRKHIEAGLVAGTLNPVVGKVMPLEEAKAAHEYVINPPGGTCGNLVLKTE